MINKFFRKRRCSLAMLFLIIAILITACNANPQKPQQQENKNKPPHVPTVLEEMESEILKTMYDIDAIEGIEIAIEDAKKAENPNSQQSANVEVNTEGQLEPKINLQQPQKEASEKQPNVKKAVEAKQKIIPLLMEEDLKGTTAEMSKPPDEIDEIWSQISNKIIDFHKKWNLLEADLRDVHGPQEKMKKFEETLNKASDEIMKKDIMNSLFALNDLTNYLADFRNSFTTKVPTTVYKIKYHIRQGVLYAYEEKYEDTQKHIEKAKELRSSLQQQFVERNAQHTVEKFDLSIEDLEKQVQEKNFDLIQINAMVVIKNVVLIEDIFKGSMP